MTRYIVQRLLSLVPVLLVVAVVVFLIIHLTPGDPASVILGPEATPSQVASLRHELGFDRPIYIQFFDWFSRLLHGDLGHSIFLRQQVSIVLWDHLGPTASLTTLAELFALVVAVPSGVLAAWKRDTLFDQLFMMVALLGVSIPSFWTGLNLILVFSVHLKWFPVAGYVSPGQGGWLPYLHNLVLPAIALGFTQAGLIARMVRDSMLDVMGEDYIRTARAKGLGETLVYLRHGLRNALIPTLTVIGTSLAILLGGAIVTETVFVIPGIGQLVVNSIARRDYPVIQGAVLMVAAIYVLVNLLVDLLYTVVDPRIKYS